MNGLEAIKVMMEGKLVSRYYGFGVEKRLGECCMNRIVKCPYCSYFKYTKEV